MTSSSTRALADAMRRETSRVGTSDPAVRGGDWRLALVATVGTDGTVTTDDGIVARRLESYPSPAVGDTIRISVSSAGSWTADGRLASGNGGWVDLTLSAGWTANASYYTPAVKLLGGGFASLCGLSQNSGTVTSGSTVATLPSGTWPAKQVRCTAQAAVGFFGVLTITTSGAITIGDFSGTLTGNKYSQFDVFSRYRLA
ncbi:hypothetical protein ACFTXJ_14170 [Streptomyces zhihengii]|uniref:hypothetical protein n=1 Tax=Streptomyces zhihengii TaxID=1818004 RepID=UPI00362F1A4B